MAESVTAKDPAKAGAAARETAKARDRAQARVSAVARVMAAAPAAAVPIARLADDFPKHKEVFARWEAASNNHFRAFHRNLAARGGEYAAEALTDGGIKAVPEGENECGACVPGGRGRGNGRGWRGGR